MTITGAQDIKKGDNTMHFYGGFTSKRGTSWNYSFGEHGWVQQYHPTIVRKTGGWRTGPDVYARKVTQECFDAIYAKYEFLRDPEHDDTVIITDLSKDVLIKTFRNKYKDTATISKTPEGKFRLVFYYSGNEHITYIKTFSATEEAETRLKDDFYDWHEGT